MKKIGLLIFALVLLLVGCNQERTNEETNATKESVYSNSWDGEPITVKQRNNNGEYELVHEITDTNEVKKLIENLGNADWQENVKVDIGPPDYEFTWNSYRHSVWINEEYQRLELKIAGQSNYGTLSQDSSSKVYKILTGKEF